VKFLSNGGSDTGPGQQSCSKPAEMYPDPTSRPKSKLYVYVEHYAPAEIFMRTRGVQIEKRDRQ
jgi:hypothetical protein